MLLDVDEPQALGMGEVLVRIEAAGVCFRDLLNLDGHLPRARRPVILGHEFAGVVVEVGEGVEGLRRGVRVAGLPYSTCGRCRYCVEGRVNLCRSREQLGEERDGVWGELVKVNARDLVVVPAGVGAPEAAIAGCVLGMLIHALVERGGVRSGETVLVTGAGGGVGIHAVMLAKLMGCTVVAYTSSPAKTDNIRAAGADYVVSGVREFSGAVREAVGGGGVDVVVDCVGEPTLGQSLRSTAWGGRVIAVGNITVADVSIPLGYVILRENSVIGAVGATPKCVEDALALVAAGRLKPLVTQMPIERVGEALGLLRERRSVGRVVVTL